MPRFPVDARLESVLNALEIHIAMLRSEPDGTGTPLTLPNHRRLKGSTLRTLLRQAGISRDEFLTAFEQG